MSHRNRIPVIIDTDPGVDDILALLLALASPELDILAITVAFGNTELDTCYQNVLKVFDIVARYVEERPGDSERFLNFDSSKPIILAKGASAPLEGSLHTAKYFHGRDGLADITTRHPELAVRCPPESNAETFHNLILSNEHASAVTLKLIAARAEREITYIALGPLTNFASAFRADRKLVSERLGRIVCMGGALNVPGNTTPVAEFNFYADPYAVREVLGLDTNSSCPHFPLNRFILCPLDITTGLVLHLPIYAEQVDTLFKDSTSPSIEGSKSIIHHFTSSILERTWEVMRRYGLESLQLHDPTAVWCAMLNPPVTKEEQGEMPKMGVGWECHLRIFDIERTGELTRGMLVEDRRETGNGLERESGAGGNRAQQGSAETTPQFISKIAVVSETPGSEILVKLLLERIWNCKLADC